MDCDCTEGCQVADRFQPATRELLVFTKSAKRYFDLDAVREPYGENTIANNRRAVVEGRYTEDRKGSDDPDILTQKTWRLTHSGAPPLDWWKIDPDNPPELPKEGQMPAVFYIGDAIETMNKLPAGSVDLILTSPPFLALRSYLPSDHELKAKEGGSQSTPGEFIDWLIDFAEASARVLAPHGSFCVELGDTYAGSGGAGGDYNPGGWREGQETFEGSQTKYERVVKAGFVDSDGRANPRGIPNLNNKTQGGGTGWPLAKSLSLIPELFRLSLVYGFNPLTGRQTERWRLRNVVRWVRPNPPVGALGDKFRPATSELMVFCKSAKRFFDLDAVREPYKEGTLRQYKADPDDPVNDQRPTAGLGTKERVSWETLPDGTKVKPNGWQQEQRLTHAGAPPLDWWEIPPGGYGGSHYAVFPLELCVRPVKAMSPERVCKVCGEPSRRMVGETEYVNSKTGKPVTTLHFSGERRQGGENHWDTAGQGDRAAVKVAPTLGWTDCGHDSWRPGLILDPFGGSGTVAAVATGHGRDCILIDLDARNFDLALGRVGPFMLTLGNIDERRG